MHHNRLHGEDMTKAMLLFLPLYPLIHDTHVILRTIRLRYLLEKSTLPPRVHTQISEQQINIRQRIEHEVRNLASPSTWIPPFSEPIMERCGILDRCDLS